MEEGKMATKNEQFAFDVGFELGKEVGASQSLYFIEAERSQNAAVIILCIIGIAGIIKESIAWWNRFQFKKEYGISQKEALEDYKRRRTAAGI